MREEGMKMMEEMRAKFAADMAEIDYELDTPTEEPRLWLVFTEDGYSREDCNVYYSYLTMAKSRPEAALKIYGEYDPERHGARPMTIKEA